MLGTRRRFEYRTSPRKSANSKKKQRHIRNQDRSQSNYYYFHTWHYAEKRNGKYKLSEPFTRAIAKYVNRKTDCSYLVKNQDTGTDPNRKNHDEFKTILVYIIKKNNIKLLIDIHGAKKEHDFDVEIGTLDGKTAKKQETVNYLVAKLNQTGIKKIAINDPFKGGQISQTIHNETGIECIQLDQPQLQKHPQNQKSSQDLQSTR